MDERHPKRREDKNNPYTLSVANGRFYLSFVTGWVYFMRWRLTASCMGC